MFTFVCIHARCARKGWRSAQAPSAKGPTSLYRLFLGHPASLTKPTNLAKLAGSHVERENIRDSLPIRSLGLRCLGVLLLRCWAVDVELTRGCMDLCSRNSINEQLFEQCSRTVRVTCVHDCSLGFCETVRDVFASRLATTGLCCRYNGRYHAPRGSAVITLRYWGPVA